MMIRCAAVFVGSVRRAKPSAMLRKGKAQVGTEQPSIPIGAEAMLTLQYSLSVFATISCTGWVTRT